MDVLAVFAGILMMTMMIVVCIDVVLRYFFNSPTPWAMEYACYSMLYIPFLVAGWTLKKEGHVKIEIITDRVSPATQALMTSITSLVAAAIFIILAWYGTKLTIEYYQTSYIVNTVLRPLKYIILLIVPLGSILLVLQLLRRSHLSLVTWRAKRTVPATSHQSASSG
jgi:TRAP-type C4-dicarboxylate transport system permease small subunit